MNWQNQLASGRVLLLDGGTGSELRRRGAEPDAMAWTAPANLEHRETLVDIHRDYILAGADIVTANTFGTARFVLAAAGLDTRWRDANAAAVGAALEARASSGRDVAIAASLSCLPPGFDPAAYPDPAAELAAYRESVELFAELGVDLVLLEMMQEPVHAALACTAANESGLPFWLGISCRLAARPAEAAAAISGMDGSTPAGSGRSDRGDSFSRLSAFDLPQQDIDATLDALLVFEPAVVAVMHSPIEAMRPGLEHVRKRWPGVLAAYAEIAYPENPQAVTAGQRMSPDTYARHARAWIEAGARIVGGCCGTTPDHVRALAALVAR